MKVSGFTVCQSVARLEYPVVEVIQSALPIVDEFIVNVGPSEDETLNLIRSIDSPKLRVIQSEWDESIRKDGLLFSTVTNIALSQCCGDWALYLQADEVLHERDHDGIRTVLTEHLNNKTVLGVSFRFLHFYGDYCSTNPWGFHRAVRIIRNNGEVASCGDAVGFCLKADRGFLQSRHRDRLIQLDIPIYHYSYVKSARAMQDKARALERRYHGEQPRPEQEALLQRDKYEFADYDVMKEFTGEHPAVMKKRVMQSNRLRPRINRWLNWRFYREVLRRGFRG